MTETNVKPSSSRQYVMWPVAWP